MKTVTRPRASGMRIAVLLAFFLTILLASSAFGQQKYVGKYDVFAGYAYFDSPKLSLQENGFHIQAGIKPRTWYAMGIDYSNASGTATLTPSLLPTALQQSLGAQLAQLAALGRLPAGYALVVPTDSKTQTITGGPQLTYRRISWMTLFVRPSIGAIREVATPKPTDPIATAIIAGLTPTGKKTDWTGFYGVGGGLDVKVTNNFALRAQVDLVRDHLFNDILRESRGTVRFSIGPTFQFGKNIVK
jgi:hypothetical protein